jgi:hypothetical protein
MNTFFSIIYLTLNADLNEKISIGMVMSNSEKVIFKYSNTKLGILKSLIPHQNHSFLKSYFKNLDCELNFQFDENLELNIKREISNTWINESYFNYLNRYSNNLIKFSEPRTIDIPTNEESFNKLFSKYIFEKEEEELISNKTNDIIYEVRNKLYTKIEDKVNIDAVVNPSDFKELIAPVNVNFIGKNDVIVAGQTIDFTKRFYNLENDLTKFISFTKAVDFEKGKGHYFLVGDEPDKFTDKKNHAIWKHMAESKMIDYVSLDETEKIQEYINKHGVTPYFKDLEASN